MTKDRRLRTLWNSNSVFVNSGYGIYQNDLLYRLLADGWPVAQSAFVGLEGSPIELQGLTIYPKMGDTWGADGMVAHATHYKADAVFSMQDVWTLAPELLQRVNHWIPYTPIDQDPVPPAVLEKLRFAYKIITFSQYGHDVLEKAGFTSRLILEGVDTKVLKPMDKMVCREKYGIPKDKFVFGMIGANKENPPRKGWQQALEAFKMFHDKHPDSVYFHQSNQFQPGGFPVREYAHYLGLDNAVMAIDPYLAIYHSGRKEITEILNTFDVLLHPSSTEGFGLVIAEAQACGIPPIVTNCTSMPELIIPGKTGELCKVGYEHYASSQAFWKFPDTKDLYDKMEKLFVADRVQMGKDARAYMLEKYDIDKQVKEQWIPFYEELQEELLSSKP